LDSKLVPLMTWAATRPRWVLAAVVAVVLGAGLALSHLEFDHDVLHLLPRRGPAVQAFAGYLSKFGSLDRLYVVVGSPGGEPIADFAAQVDVFADRLRALPSIAHVDSGLLESTRDWSYMRDRELMLFDERTLPGVLRRFGPAGMPSALEGSRTLLAAPSSAVAQLVQEDPLGLVPLLGEQLRHGQPVPVNPGADGYISTDGSHRLLIVEPVQPPFDTAFARRVLADIEGVRGALVDQKPSGDNEEDPASGPLTVEVAGGHRVAVETEALVRREAVRNGVQSLVAVLAILLFAFRSPRLVLYGAVPIVVASLVGLAVAAVFGVRLSPAAAGASAMLFGLGDDAAMLLFLRYREEWANGRRGLDVVARLGEPAWSIVLGVTTTAATFFALLWLDFASLREIGALVGGGILVCGALTLIALPAFATGWPPAPTAGPLESRRLAAVVTGHARLIVVAAATVTALLAFGVPRVGLDATLDRLRPQLTAAEVERRIAAEFRLPSDVYLVMAEGRALDPLLRAHERMADVLARTAPRLALSSPASLLPSASRQEARAALVGSSGLGAEAVGVALDAAADRAGFRPGTFEAFKARLPRLLAAGDRLTWEGYREHGLGDVIGRYVGRTPGGFAAVAYAYPRTPAEIAALAEAVGAAGPGLVLTGVPVVNRELVQRFWPQFNLAAVAGGVAVLVLVWLSFRTAHETVLALLPVALGLIWSLGALGFLGFSLDLFSAFGLLTFLGIGVDYGIHYVVRWREEPSRDPVSALVRIGPVIMLAAGTTLAGIGTLCFSDYTPLRSLGIVLSTSVLGATIGSVVVVPAIVALTRHGASTSPR
jgi:predicted RND superfamily exporter protein